MLIGVLQPTSQEKAAKLVHILMEKDDRSFNVFIKCLCENDLNDLVKKIENTIFEIETDLPSTMQAVELHIEENTLKILENKLEGRPRSQGESYVDEVLHRGKVPTAPRYLTSPPDEIKDLLKKIVSGIKKLKDRTDPGFTIVYGDVETKSEAEMTAAALRLPELWQTAETDGFPSNVVWQKIDCVRDDAELFMRLKTLLSRIDDK